VTVQSGFKSFKDNVRDFARERAKVAVGALEQKKRKLQRKREAVLKRPTQSDDGPPSPSITLDEPPDPNTTGDPPMTDLQSNTEDPDINPDPRLYPDWDKASPAEKVAALQHTIDDIVLRQSEQRRMDTRIRCHTELDRITKFSVRMSKESKPRDTFEFLQRTDTVPARGSKRSDEMAEIARDYHNDLQINETEEDLAAKNTAIADVLQGISSHENDPEMQQLTKLLTEDDIILALKQSASGSAAGVNGIPTELWKKLHELHLEAQRTKNSADNPANLTFNVVKVLTLVYNSIERHGVVENTQFSTGWMCPIWKKKDPTDIANYRPITVLNTDYKLFTKALANKLSRIAPALIH
jgi:hypothetical protein